MQMLLQDSAWSCLPTAFAMAMDVLPKEIYEFVGHTGDDIIFPAYSDPLCRRSFHIDEMLDFAISQCFYPVCITPNPGTIVGDGTKPFIVYRHGLAERRIEHYLKQKNAVFVGYTKEGKRHAVAWSKEDQEIFDPNGTRYPISDFEIEQIYVLF